MAGTSEDSASYIANTLNDTEVHPTLVEPEAQNLTEVEVTALKEKIACLESQVTVIQEIINIPANSLVSKGPEDSCYNTGEERSDTGNEDI